jgi:hypothetical protein
LIGRKISRLATLILKKLVNKISTRAYLIKLCDNTSLLNEIKEQQKKKRILSLNIETQSCRDYLTGNLEWIFD